MARTKPDPKPQTFFKILNVYENGELIQCTAFKTKDEARRHYLHYVQNGMIDYSTGEVYVNRTFDLS
jgi:hypothetical protein